MEQMNWDAVTRQLHDHAAALEAELARVNAALGALDDVSGVPHRSTARSSNDTVRVVLNALAADPERIISATEAVRLARQHGWITRSTDPVNAMRAALARAAEDGLVERVSTGQYRLAREPVEVAEDELEAREAG